MKNPYQIVETNIPAARPRRISPIRRLTRKIFGDSTVGLGRKLVFLGVPIVAALLVVSVFATQLVIDSRKKNDIVFDKPEVDTLGEQGFNRGEEVTHAVAAAATVAATTAAKATTAATTVTPTTAAKVTTAAAATPDDPEEWLTEEDRYVTGAAHLRLGASEAKSSLGVLSVNTKVTRNGKTGDWQRVTTSDGQTGFIFGEYLGTAPVEEPKAEALPVVEERSAEVQPAAFGTVKYVIPESARVRSGPSTDHEPYGFIMRGYTVTVQEDLGSWSKVETESGLVGYISNDLLSDYYIEKAAGYLDTSETVYVTGDFVYLRADATTDSESIATAVKDEALWRVATDGSWSRIQLSSRIGYIRNDLVTTDVPATVHVPEPVAEEPAPAPVEETPDPAPAPVGDSDFWAMGVTVYVNTAAARVRANPSTDSEILSTGYYGEQLTQLSTNGVWSKVERADGTVGYMSNALIVDTHPDESGSEVTEPPVESTDPPAEVTPVDDFEARDRYVWVFVSGGANIRSEASTSGSIVTTVGYGTKLTQTSSNGVWSTVYTPDGSYGYIMNSLFQLEEIAEWTPDPEPTPEPDNEEPSDANASLRQTVVNAAWSQIGMPYVWGGAQAGVGFDCSGLVLYCYNVAGYGMGLHGSNSQARAYGWEVSYGDLLPGDLLFWNSYGAPYSTNYTHVGIYVGGDQYIHAPDFGEFVRVDSLSGGRTPALIKRLY